MEKLYNLVDKQKITIEYTEPQIQYIPYQVEEQGSLIKKLGTFVCVRAIACSEQGRTFQSFGEASPYNNSHNHPIAIAEKRAKSRVVLMITGFYSQGVFGEDEAEDFKTKVKSNKANNATLDAIK